MSLNGIKVGWVGTGNMGSPMSQCLIGDGASVAVFDPNADNMSAAVFAGGRAGTSNHDVAADAEFVFSMIPDDEVLRVVAEVRGANFDELARVTTENAARLFGLE